MGKGKMGIRKVESEKGKEKSETVKRNRKMRK